MASFDRVRVVELARQLGIKPTKLRAIATLFQITPIPGRSYRKEFSSVDAKTLWLIVKFLQQGESVAFMRSIFPQLREVALLMSLNSQVIVQILNEEPPVNWEGQPLPSVVRSGSAETRFYLAPLRRAFQSAEQERHREQRSEKEYG